MLGQLGRAVKAIDSKSIGVTRVSSSLTAGDHYHDLAREVARYVLESFQYKEKKGLTRMPDYKYTMLYRLTPPTWMTDAAI